MQNIAPDNLGNGIESRVENPQQLSVEAVSGHTSGRVRDFFRNLTRGLAVAAAVVGLSCDNAERGSEAQAAPAAAESVSYKMDSIASTFLDDGVVVNVNSNFDFAAKEFSADVYYNRPDGTGDLVSGTEGTGFEVEVVDGVAKFTFTGVPTDDVESVDIVIKDSTKVIGSVSAEKEPDGQKSLAPLTPPKEDPFE